MRKFRLILIAVLAANIAVALTASAKGLLPCMVYRRGLTNEQIDQILSAHPDAQLRITAQDWRGMSYQLYRFANMTNYVEEIGNSNDCARVLLGLHDRAETLSVSNAALVRVVRVVEKARDEATERAQEYATAYADTTNRLAALYIDFTAATNREAIAEAKVARTEAVKAWLEEQRDKALLPSTKAIYQAIIDRLEGK